MTHTPKLRFPEFSDKWEVKKLGELLEFKNGINADKEQYGSGAKFINVLDILNNDYITHDKIIGSVNVDNQTLEKYLVSYGDILFQRSSETREEVGTANVYLDETKTATFGGFVIRGKKIGEYNPVFLNKLLKTDSARDNITSKSGGSTRYNVGQEILSSVGLLFPQLLEQTKIANFLTAIDEKIQALKQKKTLLEQYKKGIMQQIFSQELRFKNDDGSDFDDWEEKSLGEIGTFVGGGTPDTSNESFWGGNIQWFTPTEIKTDYVSKSIRTISDLGLKKSSAKILPKGTILLTTRATIGDAAIALLECTTNQGFQSLIVHKENDNVFVFNWIKRNKFELMKRANGSTFPEISKSEIEQIYIPVPCLKEQQKIANFLTAIDEKIEKVSQQITAIETYKKGLLQQMFC